MDTFLRSLYRQRDKKLYYVEDVNNFSKHKELTVLKNGGSPIFDWKWRLTFLRLNVFVS